jgi:transposase
MARPYFLDLRERVVALVARGETCRPVAAVFDVSVASVVKWSQVPRDRQCGGEGDGRQAALSPGRRAELSSRPPSEKPDLTLHALLSELRERGVAVSCDTLWRFLHRAGAGFKKNAFRQPARSEENPVAARSKAPRLHR